MQYTAEERDKETGFVYLRARMYDPSIGRFMQPDPLRKSGRGVAGWNRYSYVGNNAIAFTDPSGFTQSGMSPELEIAGVVAECIPGVLCPPLSIPRVDIDWRALAAAIAAAIAGSIPDQPKEVRLYRFGLDYETADVLESQSETALAGGRPHGVSTYAFTEAPRTPGGSAPFALVAATFPVKQTGTNPRHYTVELPHPVTPDVAARFNALFGRVPMTPADLIVPQPPTG